MVMTSKKFLSHQKKKKFQIFVISLYNHILHMLPWKHTHVSMNIQQKTHMLLSTFCTNILTRFNFTNNKLYLIQHYNFKLNQVYK